MKNIRTSVFETNSSSTHSISISTDSAVLLESIIPNEDGIITLTGGQFGWEWSKYNDALTKANYLAEDCRNVPDRAKMLVDVIKEHTGAKDVVFNFGGKYDSYIDHQSVGTGYEAFKDKETLKSFIFNPSSWLFLGNDNEDPPDGFYC